MIYSFCFQGLPPFPKLDFGLWARLFSAVLFPLEPTILFFLLVSGFSFQITWLPVPMSPQSFFPSGQRFPPLKTMWLPVLGTSGPWRHWFALDQSEASRCPKRTSLTTYEVTFQEKKNIVSQKLTNPKPYVFFTFGVWAMKSSSWLVSRYLFMLEMQTSQISSNSLM